MRDLQIFFNMKDMSDKIGISEELFYNLFKRKHPYIEPKDAVAPNSFPLWEFAKAKRIIDRFKNKGFDDAILLDSGLMLYPETKIDGDYYLHCVNSIGGYKMICSKSNGVYAVYEYQGKMLKTYSEPIEFQYANQLRKKCEERRSEFVQFMR